MTSWPGFRGDEWINDATRLAGLRKFADDKEFQGKWRAIKLENKKRLAAKIKARPLLPGWLVLGATFRGNLIYWWIGSVMVAEPCSRVCFTRQTREPLPGS